MSSVLLRLSHSCPSACLHRPPPAAGLLCRGVHIRSQRAHAWLNPCRRRTQNFLSFRSSRSSHLLINEFARAVCVFSGTPCAAAAAATEAAAGEMEAAAGEMDGQAPVLLFDVMGTIVRDPFYQDIPAFFGISLKELLQIKHPTAWIEFEKGLISEEELIAKFFIDKRTFDSNGLKTCVANGYAYLEGVEALLDRLKMKGYQMHAFTNYPSWYELIEEKLELSKYLDWTFVSCQTGKRKPDPEAFSDAAKQLGLRPSDIIFIDDQSVNVEAAIKMGMTGITFQCAEKLEKDLFTLGIAL